MIDFPLLDSMMTQGISKFQFFIRLVQLIGIPFFCLSLCGLSNISLAHQQAQALALAQTNTTSQTTPIKVSILMSEQLDQYGRNLPVPEHAQRLFSYLEHELKIKISITLAPWARVLQNGEQGLGLVYGISKTAERESKFNFSDAIYQQKVWLISLCERQFNYHSLNDLKNKTISISRASSVSEEFDREAGFLFKVDIDATTNSARFLKLVAHRSDAVVYYNALDAKALEKKINHEYSTLNDMQHGNTTQKLCVIHNPVATIDIHFALSKRLNSDLIARINLALSHAKRKGLLPSFIEDSKE